MSKHNSLIVLIAGAALFLFGCSPDIPPKMPWTLSELEIEVTDSSREVSFTNKRAGFYSTESNDEHRSSWQGWHIASVRILFDYIIDLNGRRLDRGTADYVRVWPHELTRSYHEGVQETFILMDSIDAFMVTLRNLRSSTVGLSLLFDMSYVGDEGPIVQDGMLVFPVLRPSIRAERPDVPGWIGLTAAGTIAGIADTLYQLDGRTVRGIVRQEVLGGGARFLVAAGPSADEVTSLLMDLKNDPDRTRQHRIDRMTSVLNTSYFRSSNARFDKALAWAKLSMDALIMEQGRKGIFAGLPWFSNYWGRDTFISLPGATLVTGRFAEAKQILNSFARWQNTDTRSPDEGRIPNIVTPTSLAYNTTDGTPWFVLGLYDYVLSSGDTTFARQLYPVVRRAVEGPARHRVDSDGFLTHGDAETWMDAVGPEGPWSPRGNRANDIQALWYRQLSASSSLAGLLGMREDAHRWGLMAEELRYSFQEKYIDEERDIILDHLAADGMPDTSLRPNQLFALELAPNDGLRARIFRRLTEDLVYPFGVGSLSPRDENFHPFHHAEPLYVQDAAYHNGIVWTWLNGAWIDHAVAFGRTDLAYKMTSNMIHQILERGAVGTLSEVLDAAPREGEIEPRLSGTFTQAWSLGEFIRTIYRDYLGVKVDAINGQVWLSPHLPADIGSMTFTLPAGGTSLHVTYAGDHQSGHIFLRTDDPSASLSVNAQWPLSGGLERSTHVRIAGSQHIEIILTADAASARNSDGDSVPLDTQVRTLPRFAALEGLSLAAPLVRDDLKSLKGPDYELISHDEIKSVQADATRLIDASDPNGDDKGPGSYRYPTTPYMKQGCLDLTNFSVSASSDMAEFTLTFASLSDPGWHPEYGFQLTYAAIAIDKDGMSGSGQRRVGRNAMYTLARGREYETIVFVGGGVQVEDAHGSILGAYLPAPGDETDPLGDATSGTIRFSLPFRMIGAPTSGWRYTVLVGAQDDHGGAGIGEFRTVDAAGGEWTGGGKRNVNDPNVYDTLHAPG